MEEFFDNNYKFIAFVCIVAYFIATAIVALSFPLVAENYAPYLQIPFFFIPFLFIKDVRSGFAKKFAPSTLVFMLWGLLGIILFWQGYYVLYERYLANTFEWLNKLIEMLQQQQTEFVTMKEPTITEFGRITALVALIPAICEETFFRGFLLQKIKKNNSDGLAILLSATIFSLCHFNPLAFIPFLVFGFFLGTIYVYTNSIIPVIVLHFINNLLVIITTNFATSMPDYNSLLIAIIFIIVGIVLLFVTISLTGKANGR